jgi:hypothetical protein
LEPDPGRTFSDEMNRREKWDRMFERKMRATESHQQSEKTREIQERLDEEKAEEDRQRQEWDAEHGGAETTLG